MTLHLEIVRTSKLFPEAVLPLFGRQVQRALQDDHAFTLGYLSLPTGKGNGKSNR